jgi:cholinesterase
VIPQVAFALQKYITDFAQSSTPDGAGVPFFPLYGTNSSEENINVTGIMPMRDPTENARCLFWEKSLFY